MKINVKLIKLNVIIKILMLNTKMLWNKLINGKIKMRNYKRKLINNLIKSMNYSNLLLIHKMKYHY